MIYGSQSELTPYQIQLGLTHLGSKASIYKLIIRPLGNGKLSRNNKKIKTIQKCQCNSARMCGGYNYIHKTTDRIAPDSWATLDFRPMIKYDANSGRSM